jgi:hypothetical protein
VVISNFQRGSIQPLFQPLFQSCGLQLQIVNVAYQFLAEFVFKFFKLNTHWALLLPHFKPIPMVTIAHPIHDDDDSYISTSLSKYCSTSRYSASYD